MRARERLESVEVLGPLAYLQSARLVPILAQNMFPADMFEELRPLLE